MRSWRSTRTRGTDSTRSVPPTLQAEQGDVLEEFGDICSAHIDYIWANAGDEDDEDDD
jgi:hypothetical protein